MWHVAALNAKDNVTHLKLVFPKLNKIREYSKRSNLNKRNNSVIPTKLIWSDRVLCITLPHSNVYGHSRIWCYLKANKACGAKITNTCVQKLSQTFWIHIIPEIKKTVPCQPLQKISWKFIHNIMSNSAHKPTNKQVPQLSQLVYILTCRSPACCIHARVSARVDISWQNFSLFGYSWAKVHQKGRWPATHPVLPSCQISSPCINPRLRYPLPKILRTNKRKNDEQ